MYKVEETTKNKFVDFISTSVLWIRIGSNEKELPL